MPLETFYNCAVTGCREYKDLCQKDIVWQNIKLSVLLCREHLKQANIEDMRKDKYAE